MARNGESLTTAPSLGGEDEPWSLISDDCTEGHLDPCATALPRGPSPAITSALTNELNTSCFNRSIPPSSPGGSSSEEQVLTAADVDEGQDEHSDDSEVMSSWKSTDQLGQDIRRAMSSGPKVAAQKQERYMKILVVGDMASGRTTAMKTLFASAAPGQAHEFKTVDREDSLQRFHINPAAMCTSVVLDGADDSCKVHYSIQETPGLHFPQAESAILDYITAQLWQWFRTEQDPERITQLSLIQDPRVDVCLYFIPPGALKPQDVSFMQALSALVPVVPILAKADAMTDGEREAFRAHVAKQLATASVECGHNVMHAFTGSDLSQAGAGPDVPPFAVIGSTTSDLSVGSGWPVREYSWGKAPVLATAASDVLRLRDLLLVQGLDDFKSKTEASYHSFRHQQLEPHSARRRATTRAARSDRPTGRAGETSESGGGVNWGKAALVGFLVLQTLGCLLLWGQRSRLQAAVDAQARDSVLREQVLHDLQARHNNSMGPYGCMHGSVGSTLDSQPHPALRSVLSAAQSVVQRASASTIKGWAAVVNASGHAYSRSKASLHQAGTKTGSATSQAAQAVNKRIKAGIHNQQAAWQRFADVARWRKVALRSAAIQVDLYNSLRTAVGRADGKIAKMVHRLTKKTRRWRRKAFKGMNKLTTSSHPRFKISLPSGARFSRFLSRAVGFYGGWQGLRLR